MCATYDDRVLLVVTERPGFGAVLSTEVVRSADGAKVEVKTLLGDRMSEDMAGFAARKLGEAVL